MGKLARHFQELMYLKVVLEQGSINRAASLVGLTQPALTRNISRLEASLGVKLLNRTARGVFATNYGEAILSYVKLINSELERGDQEIQAIRGGAGGQLTCGGTIGVVNRFFAQSINQLKTRRPKLKVRVVEGFQTALLPMLRIGELDVVVCTKLPGHVEPDLIEEKIAIDHIGLFVGSNSAFLKRSPTTLKELNATAQWILPNWASAFYQAVQHEFQSRDIPRPVGAIESPSSPLLKQLLRANDRAVAITTSNVIGTDLREGDIRELDGDWKLSQIQTVIYLRPGVAPSPSVQLFMECIRSVARTNSKENTRC